MRDIWMKSKNMIILLCHSSHILNTETASAWSSYFLQPQIFLEKKQTQNNKKKYIQAVNFQGCKSYLLKDIMKEQNCLGYNYYGNSPTTELDTN